MCVTRRYRLKIRDEEQIPAFLSLSQTLNHCVHRQMFPPAAVTQDSHKCNESRDGATAASAHRGLLKAFQNGDRSKSCCWCSLIYMM